VLATALFGTSDFAVPILDRLAQETELLAVVTTPAQRADRGRVMPSPVAQAAAARSLPVVAPSRAELRDLAATIQKLGVEVLVVAAYGRILPPGLVAAAPFAVNVHPSLLPRHRGAAPVAWTLLEGDERTGVTLLALASEVDAGPIYDQVDVAVDPKDDRGSLEGRLSQLAATRVVTLLRRLESDRSQGLEGRPQVGEWTYASKLSHEDEGLVFSRPAHELVRRVRALAPRPGARALAPEGPLLVFWAEARTRPPELGSPPAPGTIERGPDGFPWVQTGQGALRLVRVRPAGRPTMPADAYLRGRPQLIGRCLEDGP
jgi:methionyl-tRNA formyltransferase